MAWSGLGGEEAKAVKATLAAAFFLFFSNTISRPG
jgi:hypothetical protein